MGVLQNSIESILTDWSANKALGFGKNPMGDQICKGLPAAIQSTIPAFSEKRHHFFKGSIGKGQWAAVPWLMISDPEITKTAQAGNYLAYLFACDGSGVYLAFAEGVTKDAPDGSSLKERVNSWNAVLDCRPYKTGRIDLKIPPNLKGATAKEYEDSCICWTWYPKGAVPEDKTLIDDLKGMDAIYAASKKLSQSPKIAGGKATSMGNSNLDYIKAYIAQKGFSYQGSLVENFFLSLKAKPFVILAGVSGTGKTRLVRLFAEAVGATSANGRYKLVPVRPDWSDSSDLLGHLDIHGNFIPGSILDFVLTASQDLSHPYFLCLDEMNLARVEYYFSDVLSVMETRERDASNHIVSDRLLPEQAFGSDSNAKEKYSCLRLPDNLYIVGTVNMDETTFPFSKKVLDRSSMIEFSSVDLTYPPSVSTLTLPAQAPMTNDFFVQDYLILKECAGVDPTFVAAVCTDLENLNGLLKKANQQVGYRVRDEIVFYLLENRRLGLLTPDEALDNVIMQKILPRIQGSSSAIRDLLISLFTNYVGAFSTRGPSSGNVADDMDSYIKNSKIIHPKTAEKLTLMVRRFEEDGFTSYWL